MCSFVRSSAHIFEIQPFTVTVGCSIWRIGYAEFLRAPDMDKLWANAIAAYKRDGNLEKVLARMDISEENQIRIKEEGNQ